MKLFLYVQHCQFTHVLNSFRFKFYIDFIVTPCLVIDYIISKNLLLKHRIRFIDGKSSWFLASIMFTFVSYIPFNVTFYPRLTQITEMLRQHFIEMMPGALFNAIVVTFSLFLVPFWGLFIVLHIRWLYHSINLSEILFFSLFLCSLTTCWRNVLLNEISFRLCAKRKRIANIHI